MSYFHQVRQVEVVADLSPEEVDERDRCEAQITNHLRSFFECAKALKVLHDRKLYRSHFKTFEAYVSERLGLGRHYALRLVKAADILENVIKPLGEVPFPENESQVRPLTILSQEDAQRAWREVVKKSRNSKITTSLVEEVAEKFHSRPRRATQTALQQEIRLLLAKVIDAVSASDFEAAAKHLVAAEIRIDVEVAKTKRTAPQTDKLPD